MREAKDELARDEFVIAAECAFGRWADLAGQLSDRRYRTLVGSPRSSRTWEVASRTWTSGYRDRYSSIYCDISSASNTGGSAARMQSGESNGCNQPTGFDDQFYQWRRGQ